MVLKRQHVKKRNVLLLDELLTKTTEAPLGESLDKLPTSSLCVIQDFVLELVQWYPPDADIRHDWVVLGIEFLVVR